MRPFERRQNARRYVVGFLLRAAAAAVLFVLMIFSVRGAWGMYHRFAAAQEQEELAKAQLSALSQRKMEVEAAVAGFSSDRGVEAQVRERYGVAKPGEGKIEIVHASAATATPVAPQSGNALFRLIKALFVW